MKRLLTLMLACAAVLVMGIAAAGVRAEGGDDGSGDHSTPTTQSCSTQANDDRFARAAEDGTSGDDNTSGTSGDDRMSGEQGDDGADDLNGGKGDDDINGGPGNDVINSRDGQRDVVNCGAGRDRVRADRKDRVARNCESVKRS